MKNDNKLEPAISQQIRSQFISIEVEVTETGEPRLVLQGAYLKLAGFQAGDVVDAIVQPGLISLLEID
ncbi:MAG: hypothetical protein R3217_04205 [Gammaproteobacteria bacterium]|nr:hypothetical protein [Gammaproteobacteria bacterium]